MIIQATDSVYRQTLKDPTGDNVSCDLTQLEMCRAKVSEELLEALVAVGLELVVGLVLPVLEGLAAVGADEALGMELAAGEGGDDAAADALAADAALVFHAVVVVVHPHLLEEGAPEHLGHVLLLELLVDVSEAAGEAGSRVAQLDVLLGHAVEAVEAVLEVVELLAGAVGLHGHRAVVPDGLGLGRRRRRRGLLEDRRRVGVRVLFKRDILMMRFRRLDCVMLRFLAARAEFSSF